MNDVERKGIRAKISRYKKSLESAKARFGFIDDGRGTRYEIPILQMRLLDLDGAMQYYDWFWENFPDDTGEPLMNLAWIALFYNRGELERARAQLRFTVFSNLHLLPFLFGKPVGPYDIWYGSNIEEQSWFEDYDFSSLEFLTPTFLLWLEGEYAKENTTKDIAHFVELKRKLKDERDGDKRGAIIEELSEMQYGERKV